MIVRFSLSITKSCLSGLSNLGDVVIRRIADPFCVYASIRPLQQAVAKASFDASLIRLASDADGRLPRRHEAFHERHPDQIASIDARSAYAAHCARAGDRGMA